MKHTRSALAAAFLLPLGLLTACGGDDGGSADDGGQTLRLAHSYTTDQPQHTCGAQVIQEEVASADAGMSVEIFPDSQLGGDSDRLASVQAGDIDIDIQGASALSAGYRPMGIVDAAYAFDGPEHLIEFFRSDASQQLVEDFKAESGVQVIGAWSVGARHFTANQPIRTPEDLQGLRMRFPDSEQFLMNAKALGANATPVPYEELYVSLQQGVVDGQENPITNIAASNLAEVQDYLSLSAHGQNSNLIIAGPIWDELSSEQQQVLDDAVATAVDQMTECVEEDEQEQLDAWRQGDQMQVVEDVDKEAFRQQTAAWFRDNLEGKSLEVYEAIKSSAP